MKSIALIAALCATPAAAQDYDEPTCGPRAGFMETLERDFGEVTVGVGILSTDNVMEVYVSQAGSFTILVVTPSGHACIAATGENYVFVEQPWPVPGEEY